MLSSMASQTLVAPHADAVGREAKSDGKEMRSWGATDGQQPAIRPKMFEVGEVLAAPALEDLILVSPVYGTKSGTELDPKAVAAGRKKRLWWLEEQKAIVQMPRDFSQEGTKRIMCKWLDDCTTSGAEVKSTTALRGTRPLKGLRLVVTLPAS